MGVTHSHSRLSAVTHHRIIYNSVPRPSGHTKGFPKDKTGVRPHYCKPWIPQSTHVFLCKDMQAHIQVLTFASFLTPNTNEEERGYVSLNLSVRQILNGVLHKCTLQPTCWCLLTNNRFSSHHEKLVGFFSPSSPSLSLLCLLRLPVFITHFRNMLWFIESIATYLDAKSQVWTVCRLMQVSVQGKHKREHWAQTWTSAITCWYTEQV